MQSIADQQFHKAARLAENSLINHIPLTTKVISKKEKAAPKHHITKKNPTALRRGRRTMREDSDSGSESAADNQSHLNHSLPHNQAITSGNTEMVQRDQNISLGQQRKQDDINMASYASQQEVEGRSPDNIQTAANSPQNTGAFKNANAPQQQGLSVQHANGLAESSTPAREALQLPSSQVSGNLSQSVHPGISTAGLLDQSQQNQIQIQGSLLITNRIQLPQPSQSNPHQEGEDNTHPNDSSQGENTVVNSNNVL
ncbi:hypothetical protein FGO68_gene9499 [Halteria grandinella]|uniref:Uncharacterized protein n=1 Tax=Halteria grandinella TaxID=5974 RepID=A0A8J8NU19_HALGN|nr:hypothetical protein FGO68_gene9499 [Halteria grandinella]